MFQFVEGIVFLVEFLVCKVIVHFAMAVFAQHGNEYALMLVERFWLQVMPGSLGSFYFFSTELTFFGAIVSSSSLFLSPNAFKIHSETTALIAREYLSFHYPNAIVSFDVEFLQLDASSTASSACSYHMNTLRIRAAPERVELSLPGSKPDALPLRHGAIADVSAQGENRTLVTWLATKSDTTTTLVRMSPTAPNRTGLNESTAHRLTIQPQSDCE